MSAPHACWRPPHPRHPRAPEPPRLQPQVSCFVAKALDFMRQPVTFSVERGHLGLVCGSLGSRGGEGAVQFSHLLLELLNLGCSRLEREIAGFQVLT